MSELPQQDVEEVIQSLRGIGMLDWIYHVWPAHSILPLGSIRKPRKYSIHYSIDKLVKGVSTSPPLFVGELVELYITVSIDPSSNRSF